MKSVRSLIALVLALSSPALAIAAETPFPDDPSAKESVERWVDQVLNPIRYVVTGWSTNALFLVAIGELRLDAYPVVQTVLWTEVINPAAAKQAGWRSSSTTVDLDCRARRYRDLRRDLFDDAARRGISRSGPVSVGWIGIDRGSMMDSTSDEVCFRAEAAMRLYDKPTPPKPSTPPGR